MTRCRRVRYFFFSEFMGGGGQRVHFVFYFNLPLKNTKNKRTFNF